MMIDGKKINLKNINMPVLNVMAEFDHLVPNDASIPLSDAISSTDKDTLIFPKGHIGIFVGSKSQKEVCPKIAAWLKPRSDPNGKEDDKTGKEELKEPVKEKILEKIQRNEIGRRTRNET